MADRIPSGLEDDDDDALVAAVTAAEAAAAEAARRRRLEDLLGETRDERGALRAEARRANAGADAPTEDMYRQIQDLLTLFGIPYVIAPQEAEAQCAWMNEHGLVDAVVTDDSDAFLFGAKHVYRNVFESKKYVEAYAADRVRLELGLDREKMAHLALLLGSDYTEGVAGVGIVNALEIVTAFPGIEGLREFKAWADRAEFSGAVPAALRAPALPAPPGTGGTGQDGDGDAAAAAAAENAPSDDDAIVADETRPGSSRDALRDAFFKQHRSVKKGWELPPGFPSEVVIQAYARPSVDTSREKPTWGKPDLPMLRVFCRDAFDWDRARARMSSSNRCWRCGRKPTARAASTAFSSPPRRTRRSTSGSRSTAPNAYATPSRGSPGRLSSRNSPWRRPPRRRRTPGTKRRTKKRRKNRKPRAESREPPSGAPRRRGRVPRGGTGRLRFPRP